MDEQNPQPAVPPPAAPPVPAAAPAPPAGAVATVEQLTDALRDVFDPEIPINIVDLGLLYKLELKERRAAVEMTLTTPMCPLADQIRDRVLEVMKQQPGVTDAEVKLVYDPPWNKERMTFEGKLQAAMLGIM
jgi:metal-sulfur cluster biosynthetic enzyme